MQYFYPRSPCGERHQLRSGRRVCLTFLSTLSLRRATLHRTAKNTHCQISIHALLAESDDQPEQANKLSTHFYPRSPCGERLWPGLLARPFFIISIHALLAESDAPPSPPKTRVLYFYPRSPCGERPKYRRILLQRSAFLSTLSLRRATLGAGKQNYVRRNFYPRSPCGERPETAKTSNADIIFLSTLSLRRATWARGSRITYVEISIHALLAESDQKQPKRQTQT